MAHELEHAGDQDAGHGLDQRLAANLERIGHKLLVMSGKGGVGKSTVSAYLALGLAARGLTVGLLDLDLHGPSLPRLLGLDGHAEVDESSQTIMPAVVDHGLKVLSLEMLMPDRESSVIWRGPLKIGVVKQLLGQADWGRLDYLVVDCPPGTGDEPLTAAQQVDQARAVIVTTPQELALADVRKALDFCRQMDLAVLGMVENMSGLTCPHCGQPVELFGQGGGESLARRLGLKLLGRVPLDARLVAASNHGRPLDLEHDYGAAGPAFRGLVEEVARATRRPGQKEA